MSLVRVMNDVQYEGNILFVDDSQVNRMIGKKLLNNFGLNVLTAENGQQAIDHCNRSRFNLIFMDLEMPEIGGLAASTIIREEKLSYAPIFALTGTDSDQIRLLCRASHMNGFVKKPLKKDALEKILTRLF